MKISVITSCYNSEQTIRATLDSLRAQDYLDMELIIVDGGSEDKTMTIVEEYDDIVSISVSEPDGGIYDALNKGINLATGDVIGFLHSDDFFASTSSLSFISKTFENQKVDAVYGDLDYVDRLNEEKIIRQWRSKEFDKTLFYSGWMPAHPTFYLRKSHYQKFGDYDLSFKQSADYELMLRMLLKHDLKAKYIPEVLVKMRVGGASNISLTNRWNANKEDARAWKKNGIRAKAHTRWMKPLSKLAQYFKWLFPKRLIDR